MTKPPTLSSECIDPTTFCPACSDNLADVNNSLQPFSNACAYKGLWRGTNFDAFIILYFPNGLVSETRETLGVEVYTRVTFAWKHGSSSFGLKDLPSDVGLSCDRVPSNLKHLLVWVKDVFLIIRPDFCDGLVHYFSIHSQFDCINL